LEALRQGELTVRRERSGNFKVRLPVVAAASEAGQPELVLLCVKTYDLEPAVQALLPALTPTTVVLPLENGIEVPGVVRALLREQATVLGAAAYLEATRLGPDLVEQTGGSCRIALGELDGALSQRASAIAQRLLDAALTQRKRRATDS
jgi:2-dehydropantoate 2-reductase